MEFTAEQIAGFLEGEVVGDPQASVSSLSKIEEGKPGTLAFLANPKYSHYIYDTQASIVIVNKSFEPTAPISATLVRVEDAYSCFARLLELYNSQKPQKTGISPQALIHPTARIGEGVYIGAYAVIEQGVQVGSGSKIYPQVYVGDRVTLGENTTLYPGVKVYEDCVIGNRVVIHAGTVIGADGFGFAPDGQGEFHKIPQIGNTQIDDDVEIGANTCIDRATMGSTRIHRGVKLDNLIQIGHNVEIGSNTAIAAQVGIAGSTKVGSNCMMGGQVGIAGHLHVGDRVKLGSQSGVGQDLPGDAKYMGYPALPSLTFQRASSVFKDLPAMRFRIMTLEKELRRLQEMLSSVQS